jgi:pilus assembly protein CpaF
MVTVTISEKGGQQSQYDFNKSAITIGRMKGNDIVLPKGNVSKKHSRISVTDGNLNITDLNSTNGTYVNGRKVSGEQPITPNDKIYIGDFILQVEQAQPAHQAGNQAANAPPQPPNGGNQSGFGPSSAQNSVPPSPPANPNQSSSGGLGDHSVDDLFAAGDSQPPSSGQDQPRHRSSAGGGGMQGGEAALDFDDLGLGNDAGPAQGQPRRSSAGGSPGPASSAGGSPGPTSNPGPSPSPASNAGGAVPASRPSSGDNPVPQPEQHGARSGGLAAGPGAGQLGGAPSRDAGQARDQQQRRKQRLGRDMGASSAYTPGGGVLDEDDIASEFDADFHAAQHDVARVLFEQTAVGQLPLDYPPAPADRSDYERQVKDAVSKVSPRVDRDTLVDLLASECVGLGPLELYLDDPAVRDIYINRFDQILVRRDGKMLVAERAFSHPDFLMIAAQRLLGTRDEFIGADEVRFGDGTHVHIVMPPLSVDGPALTVRKPPTHHPSLDELVSQGSMSPGMREFLARALQAGRSIMVAGPTSSGKSTLLGALSREIPDGTRIITVEESTHLNMTQGSVVRLEANPGSGHDLRFLVQTAVSMHPQRIILDECRGPEAYEWVTSAASGTEGSMIAAHGTSASDALGRLESLCLLGNPEISPRGLREQITRAVDFVVVVHRSGDNDFRVRQITEVQGVDLDAFRLNDVFYYRVEGSEEHFHPTGYIPLFYEDLRHAGVEIDFDIFRD